MTEIDPNKRVTCVASPSYLALKGCMDRLTALAVLVLIWPVLLLLAWRVRRDSPGPALFRQTRCGLDGKPFPCLKFRTMRTDVDPYGDSPQHGDDPRITKLGLFLRESSLDELPQFINVLRGEMSLVGPRPLYVEMIEGWTERQKSRLQVKPGLTGFSQIHGRASITVEDKLEWDVRYVESISLKTDLWVMWKTFGAIFNKRGIYETTYSEKQERRTGR